MNILVCLKQIPDPEIPARDFRIDPARKEAQPGTANLVTNIFCENALETALQFRERIGGGTITVLTYGPPSAEDSLRKALAMKADAAAHVIDESGEQHDPLAVARTLAAAIRKIGSFDLILTGRESGDWGAGQTGGLIAEELGWPAISFVDAIEKNTAALRVKRQTAEGHEVIEARPPVVLTITNDEHNVPRIPKVRDVMLAHRQPITAWTPQDLGVNPQNEYYEIAELVIPQKESRCEIVGGDTLEQRVDALARRLVEVTASI